MKKIASVTLMIFALAFAASAQTPGASIGTGGQPTFACPQFQHYNGAGACEFDNYLDAPAYVGLQNKIVADLLNANPPGAYFNQFVKLYGGLPQNQQIAIIDCDLAISNAKYFQGRTVPVECATNGQLDVAKIVAANPASKNPSNAPSVTWDGAKWAPVVPPQPGKPVQTSAGSTLTPPPAAGRLVGSCWNGGLQCFIASGVDIRTLKMGQVTNQDGHAYIALIQMGLMGLGGYWQLQQ